MPYGDLHTSDGSSSRARKPGVAIYSGAVHTCVGGEVATSMVEWSSMVECICSHLTNQQTAEVPVIVTCDSTPACDTVTWSTPIPVQQPFGSPHMQPVTESCSAHARVSTSGQITSCHAKTEDSGRLL